MSGQAHPKQAMRPFLPEDAPVLADIFRASIEELTQDDYSAAQQDAWAAAADDEEIFAQKLAAQLTLVATLGGSPVGFASLADNRTIDMLYVHPTVTGYGIAAMLVDALEKLAGSRGCMELTVDASDTARGFFERRGYVALQRNSVVCGGEWLASTTMTKDLLSTRSAR